MQYLARLPVFQTQSLDNRKLNEITDNLSPGIEAQPGRST